jgi:hypothetical protein
MITHRRATAGRRALRQSRCRNVTGDVYRFPVAKATKQLVAHLRQWRRECAQHARTAGDRMAESLRSAGFDDVRVEIIEMAPVNTACARKRGEARAIAQGNFQMPVMYEK